MIMGWDGFQGMSWMSGDTSAFDKTLREQALAQKLDRTRPGHEYYLQHVHE